MPTQTLEEVLESMKDKPCCFGWAAILVLAREQLNDLLKSQYLDGLNGSNFLAPLSTGEIPINTDRTETAELKSVVFGAPTLAFKRTSLAAPTVTLRMPLIAGQYILRNYPTTDAAVLGTSHAIKEGMGFYLEMEMKLTQAHGNADQSGRITFEMPDVSKAESNLGDSAAIKAKLAQRMLDHLRVQPDSWRTLVMGILDETGSQPLSPHNWVIRTMRAPDSDTNPENGAIVVFINCKAKHSANSTPIEGSGLLYFLPTAGSARFSAALILNQELLQLATDTQLDVLKALGFPSQYRFVERPDGQDHYTPYDGIWYGQIEPIREKGSVSPSILSLKAGSSQKFTLRQADGTVITNATWSASCTEDPLAVGTMSADGNYEAREQSSAHADQQMTVVTARYSRAGQEFEHSARVVAEFKTMDITPRVCTRAAMTNAQTVEVRVSTLSGGPLTWPTLPPEKGTLTRIDEHSAVYTPPATLVERVELVKLVVTDTTSTEQVEAVIVLYRVTLKLDVYPWFLPAMVPSKPIQLTVEDYEPDQLDWKVLGEGTVDEIGEITESGEFHPPTTPISTVSVVTCAARSTSGLCIIQHDQVPETPLTWKALDDFSIAAASGEPSCFSNGQQQIPLRITVETQVVKVDGIDYEIPVSDRELASMKLVNKHTGAYLPFLAPWDDGIRPGTLDWAASRKRNRFRLYSIQPTAVPLTEVAPPALRNNRVRYLDLYVHLATEGNVTFYAQFTKSDGTVWRSIDQDWTDNEIEVRGIPHTPNPANYTFEVTRIAQDPNGRDDVASDLYPRGDKYSYYRWSDDFWHLSYTRMNLPVGFAVMRAEDNASTVQYESDQVHESFWTYTGWVITPATRPNVIVEPPTTVTFDTWLWAMIGALKPGTLDATFQSAGPPSPGVLRVSMHRRDEMPYWSDKMADGDPYKMYRAHLDKNVVFIGHDEEGNFHRITIGFRDKSLTDSRNFLQLKGF